MFVTLLMLQAEDNLTKEVNATLQELITNEEVNRSDENSSAKSENNSSLEQEALEKKRAEEAKRLAALKALAAKKEQERRAKERLLREKKRLEEAKKLQRRISELLERKKLIDAELTEDNMWASQYAPYETYRRFKKKMQKIAEQVKEYKKKEKLSELEKSELKRLEEEYKILSGKISQLSEYRSNPLIELIKPIKLEDEPVISNPLDIISAMSYQKHLKSLKEENDQKYHSLSEAVHKIREKKAILQELALLSDNKAYVEELKNTKKKLKDFELALEVFETSVNTFIQKVSQINLNIDKAIEGEVKRLIVTGIIIVVLLLLFILVKYLVRKYMSDNDLFYGINKVINFVFIFLIFLILLLSYLEDVENLMTILSFASAGIAIALKDWFMSVLGWLVILISGSIHVGDRVKFVKDGFEYVGDVVDISILRITLHEDVTFTSVYKNRRTGRIIFIPNNYIFTDMIANYSHAGLKTVWDGVDFYVTFDSNTTKAQHIAKEVARKYSKGYTDMTRKQLNKLRSKYSIRNTAVEPRIFGFLDDYGVRISVWYLTNSYATLTLRSTISMEILARIQEEDDIHIALPSQSIYMDKPAPRLPLSEGEEPNEKTHNL
jgi:small-conductance mechanosensitive channel